MKMWPLNTMHRGLYWGIVVGCVLFSGYFFLWFIQTAWLGSFPGRDVAFYARWAYSQLAASLVLLIMAVVVGVKGRRRLTK
jgi:hypothetical protein